MNRWKVTAIIFIILFVLSSVFIVWAYNIGTQDIEYENECSYNICAGYEAYIYWEYEQICDCYIDNEVVYTEYMS